MNQECNIEEIKFDNEGYIINPEQWSNELADVLARNEELELTEEHWKNYSLYA